MSKPKLTKTIFDLDLQQLIETTDKKTLVSWAHDCALRVLHLFEKHMPSDCRLKEALVACNRWHEDKIKVSEARSLAKVCHDAAREMTDYPEAMAAARAVGHACATIHMKQHAFYAATYALSAFRDTDDITNAEELVKKERLWQISHLQQLITGSTVSYTQTNPKD